MPELNAEQRLRDDAIVRGIIAQAQREAAQAVLDAVEDAAPRLNSELRYDGTEDPVGAVYVEGFHDAWVAARAAAAQYGAGTAAITPLESACDCGDCFHPVIGPNTDGEPCDFCRDCGCPSADHSRVTSPAAGGDGR